MPTEKNDDAPLTGERHRQPDARRMEHCRQVVDEPVMDDAPAVRQVVDVPADRVQSDVDGDRTDAGQRVGGGDGNEKNVRGAVTQLPSAEQDSADKRVGDDGDGDEDRKGEAVDGDGERIVHGDVERNDAVVNGGVLHRTAAGTVAAETRSSVRRC